MAWLGSIEVELVSRAESRARCALRGLRLRRLEQVAKGPHEQFDAFEFAACAWT